VIGKQRRSNEVNPAGGERLRNSAPDEPVVTEEGRVEGHGRRRKKLWRMRLMRYGV